MKGWILFQVFIAPSLPIGEIHPSFCTGELVDEKENKGKSKTLELAPRIKGERKSFNGDSRSRDDCQRREFPLFREISSLGQEVKGNFPYITQAAETKLARV